MRLGGSGLSGSGHRCSPSSATPYSRLSPGSSPSIRLRPARSDVRQRETYELVAEDLDLARFVGLYPDGGLTLADVTEQRSQDQLGHVEDLPGERAC